MNKIDAFMTIRCQKFHEVESSLEGAGKDVGWEALGLSEN